MPTQANQAGPGPGREGDLPGSSEAAGPASPRLVIEEVRFRLGLDSVEACATLRLGRDCFTGTAQGPAGLGQTWQLAAAASVAALQQYLQQCATGPSTPQLQLLEITATTTALGQEIIHATVRLSHGSNQSDLIGSAPVRNDRCSTAVAAALDAASRRLGRFRLCGSFRAPSEETSRARVSEPDALDIEPSLATSPPAGVSEASAVSDRPLRSSTRAGPRRSARAAQPARGGPLGVASARSPRGRRQPGISSAAGAVALGAVLGPSSFRVAAVDSSGRVLGEARRPSHESAQPEAVLALALEAVREVMAGLNSSPQQPVALGLAAPGELQVEDGVCVSCRELPGWRDVQLAAPFSEELHLPVFLLGATEAAALAEVCFGAAQGLSSLLFVHVDTEIGIALIVEGEPLSLLRAFPGQAGHMVIDASGPACSCGESGCWQALAGREALVARVLKAIRSGAPNAVAAAVDNRFGAITPALIVRMASAGDAVARRALEETGHYLAIGLANLVALFGPEAVIVDGQPAAVGRALLEAAEATLKLSPRSRLLSHCVLLPAQLGDSAPMLGAAAWAARRGG